jgi:predicted choloylglycine hydrolase
MMSASRWLKAFKTPRGRPTAAAANAGPSPSASGTPRLRFRLAPNIWEELYGLADGLKIPLERAVAEYSNARLRYPPRGCSAVMSGGLYGRNYDYDVGHYDRILVAIQPRGVNASIGFSDRFTGRLDGMNEHGLCVGLHQVNNGAWQPGLACILIVRMVLDQCATTRDAIALLRRIPHGGGYNYSLMDGGGTAAVVEAAPAAVAVREGEQLGCSNHFLSPALQAYNRRNPGSWRHLPPLEDFARQQLPADRLFKALNNSLSPVFDHRYSSGSGTLHTIVCTPAARRMQIGVGGDAEASDIDFGRWLAGAPSASSTDRPARRHRQAVRSGPPCDRQARANRPRQGLHRHAARQRPLQGPDAHQGDICQCQPRRCEIRRHRLQQHGDNVELQFHRHADRRCRRQRTLCRL